MAFVTPVATLAPAPSSLLVMAFFDTESVPLMQNSSPLNTAVFVAPTAADFFAAGGGRSIVAFRLSPPFPVFGGARVSVFIAPSCETKPAGQPSATTSQSESQLPLSQLWSSACWFARTANARLPQTTRTSPQDAEEMTFRHLACASCCWFFFDIVCCPRPHVLPAAWDRSRRMDTKFSIDSDRVDATRAVITVYAYF